MIITACGYMDGAGFGSSRSHRTWQDVGCSGPDQLRWRMISDSPFDRFGRLDLLSKSALAAVEMLQLAIPAIEVTHPDMGISLGTQFGSFEVDAGFFRSKKGPGGGSPLLFPYTLPSTSIGEIAIRYRVMGPNTCFLAGPESGLLALWEGVHLVEGGEVNSCICVGCDGILSVPDLPCAEQPPSETDPLCYAYAFLVETEESAKKHLRTALARVRIERQPGSTGRRLSDQNSPDALEKLYKYLAEPTALCKVFRLAPPKALGAGTALIVHREGS